jgi:site-specific DNA-methyltransferase (adenine-specific)
MSTEATLLKGDCIEMMRTLPDACVQMVLVDLPYATTQNKWDELIPMADLWTAWRRLCVPGSPIVLFTQMPFTVTVAASNLKQLKTEWIWEKPQGTNFLNGKKYPMKVHENIPVFCDRMPPYHPQMTEGKPYSWGKHKGSSNYGKFNSDAKHFNTGTRCPRTVLQFHPDRGFHPTQKPVALCEYLIRTYTNPGDTVLDCCMGSGTTGVAAVNTGRGFVGIERDTSYFEIAQRRLNDGPSLVLAS